MVSSHGNKRQPAFFWPHQGRLCEPTEEAIKPWQRKEISEEHSLGTEIWSIHSMGLLTITLTTIAIQSLESLTDIACMTDYTKPTRTWGRPSKVFFGTTEHWLSTRRIRQQQEPHCHRAPPAADKLPAVALLHLLADVLDATKHLSRLFHNPSTSNLPTSNPPTSNPSTSNLPTSNPPTSKPQPATHNPSTSNPSPSNPSPSNPSPINPQPVTQQPATQQLVTQQPVNQQPVNQQPVTQQPVTQQPVTQQPVTQQPVTQQPVNQQPTTHDLHAVTNEVIDNLDLVTSDRWVVVVLEAPEGWRIAIKEDKRRVCYYMQAGYSVAEDLVHAMTLEQLQALVLKVVEQQPAVLFDILDVGVQGTGVVLRMLQVD
ncbi:hypothetical protein Bbelb_243200 [Branchiostoma belcheri]|nr:hypothetical protein Bbelb_243200 [Branchiostoma belcheri]